MISPEIRKSVARILSTGALFITGCAVSGGELPRSTATVEPVGATPTATPDWKAIQDKLERSFPTATPTADCPPEKRRKIEEWAGKQGLNRFTDPPKTTYAIEPTPCVRALKNFPNAPWDRK